MAYIFNHFKRSNSILWLLLLLCFSTSAQKRFEFSHPQMGTMFRIILYAHDSSTAINASQKAFIKLDELNLALSDYREDSEINRLCQKSGTGEFIKVSNDLWQILKESVKAEKLSKGYFDITIGPMTQLWRRMKRQKQLPSQHQIDEARAKIGIKNIIFNSKNQSIQLTKKGMRIDFGGIGKGFAEDEMMKILEQNGVKSAMIEAGGNILISDSPTDTPKGWEIIIKKQKFYLKNCGVSTSGDAFQFVEIDGNKYAHILDPKTGLGFSQPHQISVIATNGTTSDWLSTALYLMNKKEGEKLAKQLRIKVLVD